ncbi:MAG: Ig-like domain-containing protein [Phycisphaerae bacterium]|nr:Ig-like domain-containing protein [Phycisphaerae bacterium]
MRKSRIENCGRASSARMTLRHMATFATAWLMAGGSTALGATFTVSKTNDENDGAGNGYSLREAIINANASVGADVINFSITGTITLTADLPAITESCEINGPGAVSLTVSGNNLYRPFFIAAGSVTIRDIAIGNGRAKGGDGAMSGNSGGGGAAAGMGGAVFVNSSTTFRAEDVIFIGNQADGGVGGSSGVSGATGGGGGGGFGGDGSQGSSAGSDFPGGTGGISGTLTGVPGSGSPNSSTAGGNGSEGGAGGGGGVWSSAMLSGTAGGTGGYAAGGGGGGVGNPNGGAGGNGGFGGGGGGGGQTYSGGGSGGSAGAGGTHGGNGGAGGPASNSASGGGGGGAGLGGAIFVRNSGFIYLIRCTFYSNSAEGGSGGAGAPTGGAGQGKGGAIYSEAALGGGAAATIYGTGGTANSASDQAGIAFDNHNVYNEIGGMIAVASINRVDSTPTNASSVQFAVVFSDSVVGVDASDFVLTTSGVTGASISGVSGSGSAYTVTVNTGTGNGTIRLDLVDDNSITDGASMDLGGPGSMDGSFDNGQLYSVDKTAPTVSSVATTPTIGSVTNAATIQIDVTMSESVSGFADGDVTATTGGSATVGSIAVTAVSSTVLRATLSGVAGSGTLSVSLGAGAVTDAVGNANAAATILSTTLDNSAPTVASITPVTATPTNADSVAFTVEFSEAVSGFDSAADVAANFTNSVNAGAATIAAVSATTYTVTVPSVVGDGTISLSVNAAAATDASGNANVAGGPSGTITIDNTPPAANVFASIFSDIGDATSAFFTIIANEEITGLASNEITVNHTGTASTGVTLTAPTTQSYSVEVTGLSGSGSFSITIAAGVLTDLAGNALAVGGTSASISRTPTAPTNGNANTSNANDNAAAGNGNANTGGGVANANGSGGTTNANANTGVEPVANTNSGVPVDGAGTDDGGDAPPPVCGVGACGVTGFAPLGLMLCMMSLRSRTLRRAMLLDVR